MEKLIKPGTSKTPHLKLDPQTGNLSFEGRSILEDTVSFYEPVMIWLNEYIKQPVDTTLNIAFDYFNSTSARMLLIILQTLQQVKKSGKTLSVNWIYDQNDDNIRESGQDFESLVKEKFNFIPK